MNINILVTRRYGTNCYLLENDSYAVVIDPGEAEPELLEFCEEQKDKPNKMILLTQCHFDHIGGVEAVLSIWNCPLLIGENDSEGLCDNRINLSGYWSRDVFCFTPDRVLTDGEILTLGEEKIRVIETAGHTKGSVCYLLGDTLFSGDTLFRMSVGRTDLPTSDFESLISSLEILKYLSHKTVVYPGHGERTTIDFEVKNNPYMR